jgi:hypothetical protein
MLLTHRQLLQSKAIAVENDLRGTLRFGGRGAPCPGVQTPATTTIAFRLALPVFEKRLRVDQVGRAEALGELIINRLQ